ncbi:MAG: aminoglycoside phosphotransferase [Microbacterium sp.]|uniref:maltokinase N-terminal cap-like domain-containing protein n=1 Tax=Microbacterium sp. TaxID=51671 RepID=UPI0039E31141
MDRTLDLLTDWMPRQRWYAGKGRAPKLRLVAEWALPCPDPAARVRVLVLADDATEPPTLYQAPVVSCHSSASGPHEIGPAENGTVLVDGPHHAAYAAALLGLATEGGAHAAGALRGIPSSSTQGAPRNARARVLSGEQSNTSIIYHAESGAPVICKLYRQLHPGLNPDIELQTALAEGRSTRVPRAVGHVTGTWPGTNGHPQTGSLAFAQEFLDGVEDAWRVALRAAEHDEDFSALARELGRATADVHTTLATLFDTRPASEADRAGVVDSWRRRLALAVSAAPRLDQWRGAIESAYARAAGEDWPPLQRVHGDYHLGQVVHAPGRGWVLLDFEGEPLRPMAERVRPDLALRDVAGMLRSFDYAAGAVGHEAATRWALAARHAFLDGYAAASGLDLAAHHTLLVALELDKAVYETVYELRNRPDWAAIPLAAVHRLAAR